MCDCVITKYIKAVFLICEMAAICHIRLSKIKNLNFASGAGHHRAKFNQNPIA